MKSQVRKMGERDLKDEVTTHIIVAIAIAIAFTMTLLLLLLVFLLWQKFDSARCLKHMAQSLRA